MDLDPPPLTPREQEVYALLQQQKTASEICHALSISMHTCRFHIDNIRRKLGIRHWAWATPTEAPSTDSGKEF